MKYRVLPKRVPSGLLGFNLQLSTSYLSGRSASNSSSVTFNFPTFNLQLFRTLYLVLCSFVIIGCLPNNPYRAAESGKNTYYSSFRDRPKHLDPAISYSSGEYVFLGLVYEPPLRYHYLKRPFQLVPATAKKLPRAIAYDNGGKLLPADAPADRVARTVYTIRINSGIKYQRHPCFARDGQGAFEYHNLGDDWDNVKHLSDFPHTGTRELVAADYVTQIKRMADPTLSPGCPILSIMSKYILGLREYAVLLRKDLETERARRRKAGGPLYNRDSDERNNPIRLDLDRHELPGAKVVDTYTYRITIRGRYPQILYWLAMPFFSPMPAEALAFYGQGVLVRKNIDLDRYPVGTGPYRIDVYDPNREIVLIKNEEFHGQRYPTEGAPGDREAGLLTDAGKQIPFIDRIVFKLEKESIPRWTKFLQGYYDASGIPSESFDQAIELSSEGAAEISDTFVERDIRLEVEVAPTTFYFAFNMLDDVVGDYTEERAKLRRAIAIAINTEERIQIFFNGRGRAAMSLIPPGIFGHEEGSEGLDPYVYRWDEKSGLPLRRSLDEAKALLVEAGYPGGKDRNGHQLSIRFTSYFAGPDFAALMDWLSLKFETIGLNLIHEATDYNRFREKVMHGNFQILHWGWHADYPDPENFLFLLYGKNAKVKYQGENVSNYDNEKFNALFKQLESMENSPQRLELIRRANRILQHDAPMVWGFHPVTFGLYHAWLKNTKPNAIAYGYTRYLRLDPAARDRYRVRRNHPRVWPIVGGVVIFLAVAAPAFVSIRRRARREV